MAAHTAMDVGVIAYTHTSAGIRDDTDTSADAPRYSELGTSTGNPAAIVANDPQDHVSPPPSYEEAVSLGHHYPPIREPVSVDFNLGFFNLIFRIWVQTASAEGIYKLFIYVIKSGQIDSVVVQRYPIDLSGLELTIFSSPAHTQKEIRALHLTMQAEIKM